MMMTPSPVTVTVTTGSPWLVWLWCNPRAPCRGIKVSCQAARTNARTGVCRPGVARSTCAATASTMRRSCASAERSGVGAGCTLLNCAAQCVSTYVTSQQLPCSPAGIPCCARAARASSSRPCRSARPRSVSSVPKLRPGPPPGGGAGGVGAGSGGGGTTAVYIDQRTHRYSTVQSIHGGRCIAGESGKGGRGGYGSSSGGDGDGAGDGSTGVLDHGAYPGACACAPHGCGEWRCGAWT